MRILITRTATAAAVAAGEKQRERPICFLASGAVRPFVWLCLTRQICSACFSSSLAVAVAVAPIAASAAPLPYAHRHASIYELSQVADFVDLHSPFLYANFGRGVRVVGRGGGRGLAVVGKTAAEGCFTAASVASLCWLVILVFGACFPVRSLVRYYILVCLVTLSSLLVVMAETHHCSRLQATSNAVIAADAAAILLAETGAPAPWSRSSPLAYN